MSGSCDYRNQTPYVGSTGKALRMHKYLNPQNLLRLPLEEAPSDGVFEKLASVAKAALGAPMAMLSLVDADGQ